MVSSDAYNAAFGLRNVYLEGKSAGEKWEPLEKYQDQYQHEYWKREGDKAKVTGHGGGDWFVLRDFVDAVRSGKSPIDIYDAIAWTSVRPLSEASIRSGNKPMAVPDFRAA